MELFDSASEAARLSRGVTYVRGSRRPITGVAISSKEVAPGSLFVALPGERTDGHDHIAEAVRAGAVAVMAESRKTYKAVLQTRGSDCSLITVPDTLKGLHELARGYVRKRKANIVAVAGSCGKTTTKEILASILSMQAPTAKTPGNLNSLYGLPLSVFSLEPGSRHGVFEIGVDHIGEMETLVGILDPDIAILTNIGESHLEKFGSVRSLVDEKRKIFGSGLKAAYIGEDCRYRNYIAKLSPLPLRRFGIRSIRGLEEVVNLGLRGWILKFLGSRMHLSCLGWHSLTDCLGAIQVADDLGCGPAQIAAGVDRVAQIPGRSKVYEGPVTVIDDSYNASFESSYAILDLVQKLSWKGRKNLAFGSMKELGAASALSHRMVAEKIASVQASNVYLHGPEMEAVHSYLKGQGYAGNLFHSNDFEEIESKVRSNIESGDLFLLKGSRVMRMERLLPTLLGRVAP